MEIDIILCPDGEYREVEAWIDEYGDDTTPQQAVAAIGKNADGSWWHLKFNNTKPELETVQ